MILLHFLFYYYYFFLNFSEDEYSTNNCNVLLWQISHAERKYTPNFRVQQPSPNSRVKTGFTALWIPRPASFSVKTEHQYTFLGVSPLNTTLVLLTIILWFCPTDAPIETKYLLAVGTRAHSSRTLVLDSALRDIIWEVAGTRKKMSAKAFPWHC